MSWKSCIVILAHLLSRYHISEWLISMFCTIKIWAANFLGCEVYENVSDQLKNVILYCLLHTYRKSIIFDLCLWMQLVRHGFTDIDAVDPSKELLALLEKKQVYKKVICDFLGTNRLPVEDGGLLWENGDGVIAWASYQIRKIADCACAGNTGNVFPITNSKGNC